MHWWTRVFVRSEGVDLFNFVDVKVIWQASMGDVLDASLKTLFNKIAAELLWQNSWKVWTEMLSSRMKQFFFLSDMPVLGLFNYREFLFQRLKVLIAGIFQVVKPFCSTNVESVEKLWSSWFFRMKCLLEILQRCKIIQTVCYTWDESQVLSEFKIWTS